MASEARRLLAESSNLPIAKQLNDLFGAKHKRYWTRRKEKAPPVVDIINPRLCDNVLKKLKPSLKKYKGCDIIDIHPGPCIWSEKLHQALSPRCHLLLEPEPMYYEPFIKPLLDRPNSKYRHTKLSGAHPQNYWATYDKIFHDELLPRREPLQHEDPRLREPNRTLLVVGTLHRVYKNVHAVTGRVNYSNLIINHFAQSSQTNSLFHAYGLVRMLLWIPENTRNDIYPTTVADRSAMNVCMDMAVDMTEVAGPSRLAENEGRRTKLNTNIKTIAELRQTENEQTVAKPDGTLKTRKKSKSTNEESDQFSGNSTLAFKLKRQSLPVLVPEQQSYSCLQKTISDIDRGVEDIKAMLKDRSQDLIDLSDTLEMPKPLRGATSRSQWRRVGPYLDLYNKQLQVEADFAASSSNFTEEQRQTLKDSLIASSRALSKMLYVAYFGATNNKRVQDLVDELRGLSTKPALIPYDREPYKPLTVTADDIWPPDSPPVLMDMQPRKENLASDITSADEANATMRQLAQVVFTRTKEALPQALQRIAPDGVQDILDTAPILTDPLRGGRLNPEDLRMRMLNREMFGALITAYLEWPFRPSTAELTGASTDKLPNTMDDLVPNIGFEEIDT